MPEEALALETILSIIASCLAILSAFITDRFKKRRSGLRWSTWTLNVVNKLRLLGQLHGATEEMPPGLQITLDGKPCKNLSVTRVIIWNAGRQIIEGSDVAKASSIRITATQGVEILKAENSVISDPGSGGTLTIQDSTTATLSFDYLEPDQGFIVEVYHTGYSSNSLKVEGNIKGHPRLTGPYLGDSSRTARVGFFLAAHPRFARWFHAFLATFSFLMFLLFAQTAHVFNYDAYRLMVTAHHPPRSEVIPYMYAAGVLLVLFLLVYGLALIWLTLTRKPPASLGEFERSWVSLLWLLGLE